VTEKKLKFYEIIVMVYYLFMIN